MTGSCRATGDATAAQTGPARQPERSLPAPARQVRDLLLVLIALTCGSSPRRGLAPRAFAAHGTRRMRSGSLLG